MLTKTHYNKVIIKYNLILDKLEDVISYNDIYDEG